MSGDRSQNGGREGQGRCRPACRECGFGSCYATGRGNGRRPG